MPRMESFAWPMRQNFRFGTFENILMRIRGWGTGQRVLVLAGEQDRLVSLNVTRREAQEAREAFVKLVDTNKIEEKIDEVVQEDALESVGHGVRYYVVKGAGHHLQNDLQWEVGVHQLVEFYDQL